MNKLRNLLVIALVITMVAVLGSGIITSNAAGFDATANIWLPRGTQPAFAEPGDTIRIEVRATESLTTTGWTATLENDVRVWEADVTSATTGSVRNGTESGYIFQVKIPEDMPIELFTLTLSNGTKTLVSDRSVSVVEDLDASFYVMHVSDEHTNLEQANADGSTSSGKSSLAQKVWVKPTFNLINPRFIVYTGDCTQTYHAAQNWIGLAEAETLLTGYRATLDGYTAPTIVIPGNHDIGWSDYIQLADRKKQWESIIGARTYSFRMGAFYVNACEFTVNDFYNWAVSDYNQAYSDPTVKYRLMLSHYLESFTSWVTVAKADKPANLMLIGHGHTTTIYATSPYPVLEIGAGQRNGLSGFYNFNKTGDTWVCPQATSRQNGIDYFNLFNGNYGANQNVTVTFEKDNNGSQTSNSATVTNAIRQNFYDGRVRFLMDRGTYNVTGGEIVSQYDYSSDKTVVDVRVNIQAAPSSSQAYTTTINISKSGNSDNTTYPVPANYGEGGDESEDPSQAASQEPSQAASQEPSQAASQEPSQAASQEPSQAASQASQAQSEVTSNESGQASSNADNTNTGDANTIIFIVIVLAGAVAVLFVLKPKALAEK